MKSIRLLFIFSLLVVSCRKATINAPSVKSSLFPVQVGNYWKYKFTHRLTDSTYSTTSTVAEMRILKETKLTDGRDAVIMVTTIDYNTDTIYMVNEGPDLVFYNLYPQGYTEKLRIAEPLTVGKNWSVGEDTTTVLSPEPVTVPAGLFAASKLKQVSPVPFCSCTWKKILNNTYWIKQGVGIVKQDISYYYTGFPGLPDWDQGMYELTEFHVN